MARKIEVILSKIWKTNLFSMTPRGPVNTKKSPITRPRRPPNDEGNNRHVESRIDSVWPRINPLHTDTINIWKDFVESNLPLLGSFLKYLQADTCIFNRFLSSKNLIRFTIQDNDQFTNRSIT